MGVRSLFKCTSVKEYGNGLQSVDLICIEPSSSTDPEESAPFGFVSIPEITIKNVSSERPIQEGSCFYLELTPVESH